MKNILLFLVFSLLVSTCFAKEAPLSFSILNSPTAATGNQSALILSHRDIIKVEVRKQDMPPSGIIGTVMSLLHYLHQIKSFLLRTPASPIKPPSDNSYVLDLQLSKTAGKRLEKLTENNIGKIMLVKIGKKNVFQGMIASPLGAHWQTLVPTKKEALKLYQHIKLLQAHNRN